MTTPSLPPDFRPTANWDALRLWASLLARLRRFFDGRGFLEVQTPLLSADTVIDRHLDPFCIDDAGRTLWLQTSPEFAMKRLLAAGAPAIYQVTRSFRQGECGPLHNPEFTIVEWYRPGDGLHEGMAILSDLGEAMLARGPAEPVSYREAFVLHAGVDPLEADVPSLRRAAMDRDLSVPDSLDPLDRDGWLDLLLVGLVAPHLGRQRPTILFDYPPSQAALARIRPETPSVAERFELFVDGIELANGYHELTDATELRRRNAQTNRRREQDGKMPLPEESRLLEAMDHGLPAATGVALGFDRLVMLAAGQLSLAAVTPFPWDRA